MNDDLLVKYLLGEATPEEQQQVQQWEAADAANAKHLQHLHYIWQESKKLEAKSTVDENAAWERFKQRVSAKPAAPKTIPLGRRTNWMRVAAALIMMIGGSYTAYYYLYSGRMITLASENAVLSETLPDGTVVTLNKHASIKYPKNFSGDTREVTLDGEAFFNVTPNKSKPFIIHANEADVQVVGTSFNVKSSTAQTEVIVETGVVQVSKKQLGVILKPKEKATVKQNLQQPIKEQSDDELHMYYRTKEFVCNNTPLSRLVPVLNDAYDTNIVIANDKLNDLRLTTTFQNQSLDNILDVIANTFNISVERTDGQIVLK